MGSVQGCGSKAYDFSDEEDETSNTAGPQPGNNITFPDGSAGVVLRRTLNGFKVKLGEHAESERWFPLEGLEPRKEAADRAPQMSPPMVLAGALAIAFVVACVQQSDVMVGGVGSFTKWSSSLFEEHVVPPPIAHDSVCTVQFCQSWGTNGLFNQIAHLIQNRADTALEVQPASYPAPPLMQLFANVIGILQMILMAVIFMNDKFLPEFMRAYKMAAVFGTFLWANIISSALTKTSAFEVYVGKQLIFSQLQAKRPPNAQDLVRGLESVGIELSL